MATAFLDAHLSNARKRQRVEEKTVVEEDQIEYQTDMYRVWGTVDIDEKQIYTWCQTLILGPGETADLVVRYLVSLEHIYIHHINISNILSMFPLTDIYPIIDRFQTNLGYIDSLPSAFFNGTLLNAIEHVDLLDRVHHLLTTINNFHTITVALSRFRAHQPLTSIDVALTPLPEEVETGQTPEQLLLSSLFRTAQQQNLRRQDTGVYLPIRTQDGTFTHCYEYNCELIDFIYKSVTPSRMHPIEYNALTKKSATPRHMQQLLTSLPDAQFPFLSKSRTLFSFQNGIFDAVTGCFTLYNDFKGIETTARYFDTPFQWSHDNTHESIETPTFDKILLDQRLDSRSRFWVYALCGRLLHNVGSLDDWQICLYIRGVAGSGKSTILKLLSMFYAASDVGYLMSDGQSSFSDEHLYDRLITLAMDIDKRTNFNVTRFNSMVSGETLSINRKYKTALNTKWTCPLAMASNAQPPWNDVGGNLIRRFAIVLFDHPVKDSDPHLFTHLKAEAPTLLVKMARCYLEAVRDYGHKSLWDVDVLPDMFHQSRRQYLVTTNPISAFLESRAIIFDAGSQIPATDFRKALSMYTKEYADKQANPITRISRVDHGHLFGMYNCTIVEQQEANGVLSVYIQGLRLQDE